jgi:membrane associated rhomboid family serine protease
VQFGNQYRPGTFGYLPVVTKNIIIINVIMFVSTYLLRFQGIDLVAYFGLHYHLSEDFRPHQFITYIFMHGNLAHIAFNMFGVYIFGQVLEQVWGPKRYLIFYLLTGLGAALAHYLILHLQVSHLLEAVNTELDTMDLSLEERIERINYKYAVLNSHVIIGASGSLFGLLGGFGMLFPNRYVYLYFLFPVKAKWLVIFYGAAELLSAFQNNPEDNVAHFAHVGGLIVGVFIVMLWRRRDRHNFY